MGPADDPGGDTLAKTAWRATLAGTADDPGGDGALALAKRAWQATLAGTADDPDGDRGRQTPDTRKTSLAGHPAGEDDPGGARGRPLDSERRTTTGPQQGGRLCSWRDGVVALLKELGGRPRQGRRTTDSRRFWHSQNDLGGRPWRGRGRLWRGRRRRNSDADDGIQTTLAQSRRTTLAGTHLLKQLGGRRWRGRRTTLAGTALGTRKKRADD